MDFYFPKNRVLAIWWPSTLCTSSLCSQVEWRSQLETGDQLALSSRVEWHCGSRQGQESGKGIEMWDISGMLFCCPTWPHHASEPRHPSSGSFPESLICGSLYLLARSQQNTAPPASQLHILSLKISTTHTSPVMAEFVRSQIFGTTFETTSRYFDLQPVGMGVFGIVWYIHRPLVHWPLTDGCVGNANQLCVHSSAKDQLTN